MVECTDPSRLDAHCSEGQQLFLAGGDPDGHCFIGGACARCAENARTVP
jgi:hypothetical protein